MFNQIKINRSNPISGFFTTNVIQAIENSSIAPNYASLNSEERKSLEESLFDAIGDAPSFELGHRAMSLFILAKTLKTNPAKIAAEIAQLINVKLPTQIKELSAKGPYLNIVFEAGFLTSSILTSLSKKSDQPLLLNTPKTMIEYSQPNTHKVLHVGHMRNLCLGNALIRILKHSGFDVTSATYPGDVGTHVAKCLWYLKNHEKESAPATNKGAWLGKIYAKGNSKLEDELGTDKEESNRKELTEILKQLHAGSGEYHQLWSETKQWSLDQMQECYSWASVEFDRWFFESEVDAPSLKLAQDLLSKGLLIKDQGAVGMNLEDEKLGFCMLIKSDGTGLYSTKDVELARRKFEEFGIEKNIYVVDNRQGFHFKQVFKVLEKIGFKQAKDCFHLAYEMVELKDGAMSSRKGNIVALQDLIAQMQNKITSNYLDKYKGIWSDQQIQATSEAVANGAIKYGMLRVDNNRKIVFDMEEWLKLDGETGPYLQYVHARICSMLEKGQFKRDTNYKSNILCKKQEQEILLKLSQFNEVIIKSSTDLKTLNLCAYLYQLGKLFNSFYAECPVLSAEDSELKNARLALCDAVKETMRVGLDLLGIKAPTQM